MKKIVLALLIILVNILHTYAQCCSAGNPVGSDGSQSGLIKNQLKLYTTYIYSLSEDYYHYDKKHDIPELENSYFDFVSLSAIYGVTERLTLNSKIGYFINKTQNLNINQNKEVINSQGLGDLLLSARYSIIKTFFPKSEFTISLGTKLPIGAFNEEIDGITVPVSLQPSSGALKFNSSLFYSRKIGKSKFGWSAFTLYEYSNFIEKDFLIYQYGSYIQLLISGSYTPIKKITLLSGINYEWRGLDKREDDIIIESSGSKLIYFRPQVQISINENWHINILSNIPLYKYMNGYQLTNKFLIGFGLIKVLNF